MAEIYSCVPVNGPEDPVKVVRVLAYTRISIPSDEAPVGKLLGVDTIGDGVTLTIDTSCVAKIEAPKLVEPVIDEELMIIARLQQVVEDRTDAEILRMLKYLAERYTHE